MPTTDSPAPDPRFDRQARYISALEQLADPAPVTRLSGAQSLIWLIDEWLADETLPGPTRHAEATALIDSLCAYIRSPYPMAPEYEMLSRDEPDPALSEEDKRNFPHDKAEFDAEVTVRLTLLLAVHTRVIGTRESPGPWSGFAYDFSGSVFFYPVNLSGSYWSVPLNMAEATFCADADFSSSTYLADAIFNDTVFNDDADFSHSIYGADVHFNKVHFNGVLNASSTIYEQGVSIQGVCLQEADLSGCLYHGNTWIDITHHGHANLSRCLYYGEHIDLSSSYLQGLPPITVSTTEKPGWATVMGNASQTTAAASSSQTLNTKKPRLPGLSTTVTTSTTGSLISISTPTRAMSPCVKASTLGRIPSCPTTPMRRRQTSATASTCSVCPHKMVKATAMPPGCSPEAAMKGPSPMAPPSSARASALMRCGTAPR